MTLFNLGNNIKEMLSKQKEHQAESLSNQLLATNNVMSTTMNAINQAASWSSAYTTTPTISMFILTVSMAITPITNLKTSTSGAQASFSTALLLPHGLSK